MDVLVCTIAFVAGLPIATSAQNEEPVTEEPAPEQPVAEEPEIPLPEQPATEESAVDEAAGVGVEPETEEGEIEDDEPLTVEDMQSASLAFEGDDDWIQLTSGEWLKGNIERMREDKLEFDSDKLGVVTITWSKIARVRSPAPNTYVFVDRSEAVGPAVVTKEEIIVETKEGVRTFERDTLLSIIEGRPRERNWWSCTLRLGVTGTRGNADQITYTAFFSLTREDEYTLSQVSYDGTFGRAGGVDNTNRHLGTANVNVYVSKRFYLTPITGQLLYDRFQNTRFRATPAAGFGHHLVDIDRLEWDVEAGLGYQFLRYLSTPEDVDNPQSDGFVLLRTLGTIDITDDVKFTFDWRTNLVFTTIGNTNHVGTGTFSFEITEIFSIDVSFLYLRTEDPAPREDDTIPVKNDYQVVVGLALEID